MHLVTSSLWWTWITKHQNAKRFRYNSHVGHLRECGPFVYKYIILVGTATGSLGAVNVRELCVDVRASYPKKRQSTQSGATGPLYPMTHSNPFDAEEYLFVLEMGDKPSKCKKIPI